MPVTEVFWAIPFAALAAYAFILLLIMIQAAIHPQASIGVRVLIGNSALIGVAGGLAYAIWESFLR